MRSDSGRSNPETAPLLGQSREQDRRVVDELFTLHYTSLVRFAWGYVVSGAIAEELVQEAFVRLWERKDSFQHSESIRAWLYITVRRLALNHLKHQKVREKYDDEWVSVHTSPEVQPVDSMENAQEYEDVKEAIREAVMNLPERSRITFTLHRFEGLTYEEIAQIMDVSVKTVESQMTRTLKKLRSQLSAYLPFALLSLLVG